MLLSVHHHQADCFELIHFLPPGVTYTTDFSLNPFTWLPAYVRKKMIMQ